MTVVALPELEAWLASEIAESDRDRTMILAGHYAIFSGGASAVDLLDTADPAGGPAEMLEFTRFTWDTACQAVSRARNARLLVLVDDIQFIAPAVVDRRTQEQLAAALAAQYVQSTPRLPAFHERALARHSLDDTDVVKHSQTRQIFSERELRIAHVTRLRALMKRGAPINGLTANEDLSRIVVSSEEHGEYCLVHSGRTTCAGGYVELLCTAHERGMQRVISLVPMRCLGPITVGTTLGAHLMQLDGLSVTNVAIPDIASGLPAAVAMDARV